MTDPSIIIVVITLVTFVLCILILTKVCECAFDRRRQVDQRRSSTTSRTSIYIIEDNGEVMVINPGAGDVEKYDVKHSYENLAPPPYFVVLNTLAAASYELPPSYPIET
ncbi:uncharacterized protein LOC108911350 [Anoplophora glabripennis]|uniref:uncharacterized protein LOC108911350 n=1 Tax=Anoplophora glabripennis TaxID=217634 RepID=UPI0008740C17|nr:uncharacterized protein LOC108911350 [Anoplophora glabripennis]